MNTGSDLTYMASLYMALADKTRLRLLNLMREREICVGYFTDVLGQSQPKISRHLAYLRNAGIVEARRDGKWMHYSIRWPQDRQGQALLEAVLRWLSANEEIAGDWQKYQELFGSSPVEATSFEPYISDVYASPDMNGEDEDGVSTEAAHNELEEFLL